MSTCRLNKHHQWLFAYPWSETLSTEPRTTPFRTSLISADKWKHRPGRSLGVKTGITILSDCWFGYISNWVITSALDDFEWYRLNVLWSPGGMILVTFFASRQCSSNRNRTGLMDSPTYWLLFSWRLHSLYYNWYTTFFCLQSSLKPDLHKWHFPPRTFSYEMSNITKNYLGSILFFQSLCMYFRFDLFTTLINGWSQWT